MKYNHINENIKFLRTYSGLSQQEFGALFNVSRDNIASYERGTEPKIEFISEVVNHFHVDYADFIHADLSLLEDFTSKTPKIVTLPLGDKKGDPKGDKPKHPQTSPSENFSARDKTSKVTIPIVDISAAAGQGTYNPDYIEKLDTIAMPARLLHAGVHNCISVKGQSMAPTLQDGSYIVCRLLDRAEWGHIKDGYVYVVTNREGETFIKRIKNRFGEHGFIVCCSDNPEKGTFPNFNLSEDEIHNIWFVEWYLSAKMPNIHDTYYNRLQEMSDDIDDLKGTVAGLVRRLKPE